MKKFIALLLAAVMLLSVLAGCNNEKPEDTKGTQAPTQGNQPEATKGTEAPTPTVDEGNPLYTKPTEEVNLQVWYAVSGVTATTFEELVNEYMAANPNIKIELSYSGGSGETAEKVSANLLTGTAPDVALMYAGPLYTGGSDDWALETLIEDPAFDKDGIYEGAWQYCQFQGRNCALPYAVSVPVLYYNKAIVEAAGIDIEKEAPKTWDELYALAERCVKDGGATYGIDINDAPWVFKTMLSQNGNSVVALSDGTVTPVYNDDAAVEVGEFWQKLATSGMMPIDQHSNADKTFQAGQTAFLLSSSIRLARWGGNTEIADFGCLPIPAFKNNSAALGGPVLVALAKDNPTEEDNKRLAAAWDLLKFLMSEEKSTYFALTTGYLPVYASAMESDIVKNAIAEDARRGVVYGYMENSWAYVHFDEMGTMDNILWGVISEIENGKDVADALNDGVEDLLDEM